MDEGSGLHRRLRRAVAPAALAALGVVAGAGGAASVATPPASVSPPAIAGEARLGRTLIASSGTWRGSQPITFAYRWQRCNEVGRACARLAVGPTYVLAAEDVGRTVRVVVTATNLAGSAAAASAPTAVVEGAAPRNVSPPTLSGRAQEGRRLGIRLGTWSPPAEGFGFAWQRCDVSGGACLEIEGETRSTYRLKEADVGRTVRAAVTARNAYGASTALTKPSPVVAPQGRQPVSTSPPTVSGLAQEGQTLAAKPGIWTGAAPIAFRYGWQRCDELGAACALLSATGTRYTLTAADVGRTIRAAVTGSNAFGSSTAHSKPTPIVTPALPPGGKLLPGGAVSVPVDAVEPPDRLVVDRVAFSPSAIRSRAMPVTARFRVVEQRGYLVTGALVYALGLPRGWIRAVAEQPTGEDGWASLRLVPTAALPLRRGSLVLFVRVRKPGEDLLAGVSNRRLVQLPIRP